MAHSIYYLAGFGDPSNSVDECAFFIFEGRYTPWFKPFMEVSHDNLFFIFEAGWNRTSVAFGVLF